MKPVRVALFAPGINTRVMTKALAAAVDAVILDLEDSVPIASKAEARALVASVDRWRRRDPGPGHLRARQRRGHRVTWPTIWRPWCGRASMR